MVPKKYNNFFLYFLYTLCSIRKFVKFGKNQKCTCFYLFIAYQQIVGAFKTIIAHFFLENLY
jgi:hypothetical protein